MNTPKYINPFTDYGFKLIFGTEANKDLLIDFLNAVFNFQYPIVDVIFSNTEQLPATEQERRAIYDIFCTDSIGNRFIVEMQKSKITHFKDRALIYVSFPIQAMTQKGDWDFKLDPIYYLSLLDFWYEPQKTAKLDRLVQLIDQYGDIFYKKLQMKFIQLPVFDKKLVDLQSRYDQWIYFLKHIENMDAIPELFMTDSKFKKAITIAEIAKMKPEDALKYNLNRMEYMEIKGVSDASFADGRQTMKDELSPLLEAAEMKAEQAQIKAEQAQVKAEQEQKERKRLIASLRRLIESGVPEALIADSNDMTVTALKKMLEEEG